MKLLKDCSIWTFIILCSSNPLFAQRYTNKEINPRFWVTYSMDSIKKKVGLYKVSDSSIFISKTMLLKDYYINNYKIQQLKINTVESISYRNGNHKILGILIGGVSGIVIGYVKGYSKGDDQPNPYGFIRPYRTARDKALSGSLGGAIIGTCAGVIVGSIKLQIPINGSLANYSKYKNRLEKKSIRYKYLSGK